MNHLEDSQWNEFEVGEEILWPSFLSTSEDLAIALKFTKEKPEDENGKPQETSALFEILLDENAYALSLKTISMYEKEKEVLLYPYHRFKVIAKSETSDF